jgi:hypothetical protein
MVTYSSDPNHWANRYPWNRKGTAIRKALEQFLLVLGRTADADQEQRKAALQWASEQLDKKPKDLFP